MNNELDNKIEEAFLENVCDVAECTGLSYSTFARIAKYFYNEGKKDTLEEMYKDRTPIPAHPTGGHMTLDA